MVVDDVIVELEALDVNTVVPPDEVAIDEGKVVEVELVDVVGIEAELISVLVNVPVVKEVVDVPAVEVVVFDEARMF